MENNSSPLNEVEMLRREVAAVANMNAIAISKLEGIFEDQEQIVASLVAGYAELSAIVNALVDTVQSSTEFEKLAPTFSEGLEKYHNMMMSALEGFNASLMDPGNNGPGESVENLAD